MYSFSLCDRYDPTSPSRGLLQTDLPRYLALYLAHPWKPFNRTRVFVRFAHLSSNGTVVSQDLRTNRETSLSFGKLSLLDATHCESLATHNILIALSTQNYEEQSSWHRTTVATRRRRGDLIQPSPRPEHEPRPSSLDVTHCGLLAMRNTRTTLYAVDSLY